MEQGGSSRFQGIANAVRKKRTPTIRRRPDSAHDISTPPSVDVKPGSIDDNHAADHNSRTKELSLTQRASQFSGPTGPDSVMKNKKLIIGLDQVYNNGGIRGETVLGLSCLNKTRSCGRGLASVDWKRTSTANDYMDPCKTMPLNRKTEEIPRQSSDGLGTGIKKVKLKVGGVTRTIDANSSSKIYSASDASTSQDKTNLKVVFDSDREKRSGLQGIPWKDFSKVGVSLGREETSTVKRAGKNGFGKQGEKPDSTRKNRRAAKKRPADCLDDDDDDNDDEIRYLEKLKNAKLSFGFGDEDEESSRKHRRLSKFSGNSSQSFEGTSPSGSAPLGRDGKKKSASEDIDFEEDKDLIFDGEPDSRKKKKTRRELIDSPEPKRELTLTTRQRSLQLGKDAFASGGSVVEFPNGLPPAPSRKQKEVLTEVEQQLKKAEAAQRRKMQNEKAARESEAEAIRKILGQDSNKKKKEDKKKKRVADLAQEKAADELMHASSTVRLVMGPNGTTVTFPNEMGLPSIFSSGPHSYPPPREKCVGPSCSNAYKYRDSKTKLPLCSLQCYKAVQGNTQREAATC
ncbi:hypothetical protein vseg_016144 [Gypsophila vaccaria]